MESSKKRRLRKNIEMSNGGLTGLGIKLFLRKKLVNFKMS